VRPAVLANTPPPVAKTVESPADRKAGDSRAPASRRLSVVLALPFSPAPRPAPNHLQTSETDPLYGSGASDLGSARIYGELLNLGFEISECTVSRYLTQIDRSGDSGKGWLAFLKNQREAIVAMDFFTVSTATFPGALLLLRDQPQPAEHSALQCYRTSQQSVDRPATARGFPGGSGTQVLGPRS
jgi:hypothetical protein